MSLHLGPSVLDTVSVNDLADLQPLSERGSLVDQVRDSIFAAITSGRLDPGARLREIPLSLHFGVSTTPVREALRRLESEGLVEVQPRRGAVVLSLADGTVSDLYDLRLILETAAGRLAALRADLDLAQVYALMAQLESLVSGPSESEFAHVDVQLHRAIHDLSGNRELAETAERVHRRIQSVRVRAAVPGRLRIAQNQHADIVEALRKGEPDLVEAAIRRHVESAKDNVLTVLRSRREAGTGFEEELAT
jgi:DNA-binding GntR family transcriptional regulator